MTVVFDASVLIYIIDPNAPAPIDTATGQSVPQCKERVEHLINELQKDGAKIIIPTPALGEVLVRAANASKILTQLTSSKHFKVVPFDEKAAVEFSLMQSTRTTKSTASRTKAKFDDQIVAIARVERASVIYSDDADIAKMSGSSVAVIGIAALPLPPAPKPRDPDLFDLEQRDQPQPGS
ncbi:MULTISPECIES: type II toxin-antitoxin system VapC family toxin [unclassified Bradyrhizobium]|uniref:type II toxin-antitoxin system VapC family toxin n=1 Tax=unclassified Bradyrhizobium TaxID=2631580 RepID=UPI002916B5D4|nr:MULTISPECIES: type II toxin-antitoxin system VapC family toxin [unclassified Bradyrhizobium]